MREGEKQEWLVLELDEGWTMVVPEIDIERHHFMTISEEGEKDVRGLDCPCGVKIEVGRKMIVHNSFRDKKKIEESMSKLDNPK